MIGESRLVAVSTAAGTATVWNTTQGQGALLAIGLCAGTASAALTATISPSGTGTSGSATLVMQCPANDIRERRFVSGVVLQQLTVTSTNAADINVEVL